MHHDELVVSSGVVVTGTVVSGVVVTGMVISGVVIGRQVVFAHLTVYLCEWRRDTLFTDVHGKVLTLGVAL